MGTRSLTHVYQHNDPTPILTLYRQYDGYPEGHGQILADFLSGRNLVNGFTPDDVTSGNFNGMGCLAAQLVAHLKEGIGGIYVERPAADELGEEFIYSVFPSAQGHILLRVECGLDGEVIWQGLPEEFDTDLIEKRHNELHYDLQQYE